MGPSIDLLTKISDSFDISLDELLDGNFDPEWVRYPVLNPKYQTIEGSRLRTSIAALRWIESKYGKRPVTSLRRILKLPLEEMNSPEKAVRIHLLVNLLSAARARGLSDNDVFEMGSNAILIPENSEFKNLLGSQRTPKEMYEIFILEHVTRFDKNYTYSIEKSKSDYVTIKMVPNENRIAEDSLEILRDQNIATYRWGVAAGLMQSMGEKCAKVTPLRFERTGMAEEIIRVDWNTIPVKKARSHSDRRHLALISNTAV